MTLLERQCSFLELFWRHQTGIWRNNLGIGFVVIDTVEELLRWFNIVLQVDWVPLEVTSLNIGNAFFLGVCYDGGGV